MSRRLGGGRRSLGLCGCVCVGGGGGGDACIRYNTVTNKWEGGIAAMPKGVNHAAAATDGVRMYVAGGRDGRNTVGNGFNYLQASNSAAAMLRLEGGGACTLPRRAWCCGWCRGWPALPRSPGPLARAPLRMKLQTC